MEKQEKERTEILCMYEKSIHPGFLFFRSKKLEESYQESKNINQRHIYIIIVISFLNFFLCLLINVLHDLKSNMELQENMFSLSQELYIENYVEISLGILLEIIVISIRFLKYFRGYSISLLPIINLFIFSYKFNLVLNISDLFFPPPVILNITCVLCISLVCTYNWMHSEIILFILSIVLTSLFILSNIEMVSKALDIFSLILLNIIFSTCARFLEYNQRQNFFLSYYAIKIKQNYETILQNFPEPILIEREGKITFDNKAFNQINSNNNEINEGAQINHEELTRNKEDNLNVNILENIINKNMKKSLKDYVENSQEIKDNLLFEYRNQKNRKNFIFQIISSKISFENENQIVYLMKNFTEIKRNQSLQYRKKYSKLFIGSITHQFRTPLNMIQGNSDLLKLSLENPQLIDYVNNILKGSNKLEELIEHLIDISQLLKGEINLSFNSFSISTLIDNVMNKYREKCFEKNLFLKSIVDSNVPQIIVSDEKRLSQVIECLLKNAITFTLTGGIEIKVFITNDYPTFKIEVIDSGIGIEEENIPKLFHIFGKLDNCYNLNPTGMGIDLCVSKKIMKKLNGTIEVKSLIGIGSTFILQFASSMFSDHQDSLLNQSRSNLINDKSDILDDHFDLIEKSIKNDHNISRSLIIKGTPFSKKNNHPFICVCSQLLIVDDDFNNRMVLSSYCKKLQILFEEAIDGKEALEKVQNKFISSSCCKTYKLILMDSNMPIMNGEDSSIEIRLFSTNRKIIPPQIFCVTANENIKEKIKISKTLIYDKLYTKPISFTTFKDLIQFVIRKY